MQLQPRNGAGMMPDSYGTCACETMGVGCAERSNARRDLLMWQNAFPDVGLRSTPGPAAAACMKQGPIRLRRCV